MTKVTPTADSAIRNELNLIDVRLPFVPWRSKLLFAVKEQGDGTVVD